MKAAFYQQRMNVSSAGTMRLSSTEKIDSPLLRAGPSAQVVVMIENAAGAVYAALTPLANHIAANELQRNAPSGEKPVRAPYAQRVGCIDKPDGCRLSVDIARSEKVKIRR